MVNILRRPQGCKRSAPLSEKHPSPELGYIRLLGNVIRSVAGDGKAGKKPTNRTKAGNCRITRFVVVKMLVIRSPGRPLVSNTDRVSTPRVGLSTHACSGTSLPAQNVGTAWNEREGVFCHCQLPQS